MRNNNYLVSFLLVIFSLMGYLESNKFSLGADIFPKIIFVMLFILSSFQFILTYKGVYEKEYNFSKISNLQYIRITLTAIAIISYVILTSILGYLLATPLFIIIGLLIFNERSVNKIIFTSIFVTIILYIAFKVFFLIPLPLGILNI